MDFYPGLGATGHSVDEVENNMFNASLAACGTKPFFEV